MSDHTINEEREPEVDTSVADYWDHLGCVKIPVEKYIGTLDWGIFS